MRINPTYVPCFLAVALAVCSSSARGQVTPTDMPSAAPAEPSAPDVKPPPSSSVMEKVRWGGRLSVFTGLYDVDSERAVSNGFDPILSTDFETDTGMVGAGISGFSSLGNYVADLVLEYTDIDRFSITEAQFRLNRRLNRWLNVFAGYRVAQQGDGFANDDIYRESGYLVGTGAGPVALPFVDASRRLQLAGAVTYNGSELELPSDGGSPSADGLVLSLRLSRQASPWSVSLRYRRFAFDNSTPLGSGSIKEDVTEQYVSAAVEYLLTR